MAQGTRPHGIRSRSGKETRPPREKPGRGRERAAQERKREARREALEDRGCPGNHGKSARALGNSLRERGSGKESERIKNGFLGLLIGATSKTEACRLLGKSRTTLWRAENPR